ncbi:MAG TPA: hypothetical protein VF940_06390 [Streptosporangiaceae bacterium]
MLVYHSSQPGPSLAAARSSEVAAGRSSHARLGSAGHRRRRHSRDQAEGYLGVFFTRSRASGKAGQEALVRMHARTEDRDAATTWATRQAQYDAVCSWGSRITRCRSG